jgi:predicted nucleic acid-binding protein
MTSWIVIDSGILIASVITETHTSQVDSLLKWIETQELSIAAPHLIHYELSATFRKLIHRGTITTSDGARLLRQLLMKDISLLTDTTLVERALEFANEHGLPSAYDCQYLPVAERLQCDLWTLDQRLLNAVQPKLSWVKNAARYTPPLSIDT